MGETIRVITDGRDLRGHAAANRFYGTTLTQRMQETANEVEKLNRAKAPYEKKAMVIRAAKLPRGLYGCEVAPANEVALRALRTLRTSIYPIR